MVLAYQAALAVLGAEEELVQVSHSDQQMLFMRMCLPGETWVSSQLTAGAGAVGEAGAGCVPYTMSQPLNRSISTRHRYVCGLGEQPSASTAWDEFLPGANASLHWSRLELPVLPYAEQTM